MKPKFRHLRSLAIASSALLSISYAQAAPFTWTNVTGGAQSWTTATNWSGSAQYVSGSGNELMFFSDSTTNIGAITQTFTNVPTTLSMNTLTLNGKGAGSGASSSNITVGTGSTWTIGDGVTSIVNLNANFGATAAAGFNTTVAANLTLNQAVTTFTGNGTGGFTFSGNITDGINDHGITKSGSSALTLSGNSTYSGNTLLSAGTLRIGSASVGSVGSITSSAIGTGGLTLGGGTFMSNSTTARTILNAVTFTGNVTLGDATNTGKLTFSAATGLGAATRTLTTNSEVEFAGAISSTGAFGITKAGAGDLILSTSNNYTGITTINAGVLRLNNATALPGGIGTGTGTSALTFNGGVLGLGADNFTRNLGTAGTTTDVNFTGGGGWAAYTADRLVNLGGAGASITWATANTGFNGQILTLGAATSTHKVTLENALNLGNAARTVQTLDGTAAVDGELSGVITGIAGGGLTKTGAGVLVLSNASNSYVGATTVNAGVLRLTNAGALPGGIGATGTSALVFTGGILGLDTATNFTRPLGTSATATAVNFSTTAGGWAAYGADRVVNLGGASAPITWATANTGFNNLTLILGHATSTHMVDLQNPLVVTTSRTVQVDNGAATIDAKLSGNISGSGGGINKTGTGALWISGNMSQTGGITFNSGGLTLSGTNTYSGATNFNGAGIQLIFAGIQAVSPNSAYVMNINASTSDSSVKLLDDTSGVNGSLVTATGSTFTIQNSNSPGNAHTFIVGNNNTANGGTSSGTTTGSTIAINTLNWNTYAAGTTAYGPINIQGTDGYRLQINSVVLHNAANLTSGTVGQTTFNPTTANVTMGTVTVGTGNVNLGIQTFVMDGTSSDNRVTGTISDASDFGTSNRALRVTKSNTSTWTLSGNNTYSGPTSVSGGTLIMSGDNTTTGLITVSGATGATLTLSGNNSGMSGGVTLSTSTGTSASSPRLNINSATALGTGTLNFGGGAATDVVRIDNTSLSAVTVSTANAITMNRNFTFVGTQDLNLGTGAVDLNTTVTALNRIITTTASTLTLGGALGNTGAGVTGITKQGAGTLAFNGNASYTGTTVITTGILELGGTAGRLSATSAITNNANLTINRSNAFAQASDLGAGVAITGTGSFTQAGAGTTTLTAANTYQGVTTISAGTLSASSIVVSGGSSNLGNAATSVILGSAGAQGTLSYTGTSNTYTRGFTIGGAGGGRLDVTTGGQTLAVSTGNVTGTGLFTVGGAGNTTVNSNLTHTGGLTKADGGTMTINGTGNTYTGATNVNAGTLLINGSTSSTSLVSVAAAGTLGGSGTVGGHTTISGTHSPGNSPGIIIHSGNLTYETGANVLWELVANSTASRGTNFDGINVGATLDFNGATTLNLNFQFGASAVEWSNAFWASDYTGTGGWLVYSGATSLDGFGNLALNLPAAWLDENGDTLASARSGASFSLFQDTNNIYLNYSAVPEPNVAALIGALGTLLLLRRRR